MPIEVITSLISSAIGGLLVAIFNWIATHRKTLAETEKLKAEAAKLGAETRRIFAETQSLSGDIRRLNSAVEHFNDRLPSATEKVIYDGRYGIEGYDISGSGSGELDFEDGLLTATIIRIYEIRLERYLSEGTILDMIPQAKPPQIDRKIRVSCELQARAGQSKLTFFLRGVTSERPFDRRNILVQEAEWRKIDVFFKIPAQIPCRLGISCSTGSRPHSVIRLKNLVLAEGFFHMERTNNGQ